MNRTVLRVIALLLGAILYQGRAVAEGDCPAWLLPRASLQDSLRQSPTGLFPDFFSSPVFPFVIDPAEQIVRIELNEMTVAQAQQLLDKSLEENPVAVFAVHVTGEVSVSSVALSLHDRTCMVIEKDGKFAAAAGCTSESLLHIFDGAYVSITGSYDPRKGVFSEQENMFCGKGVVPSGIRIEQSGRIHLDRISIAGCKDTGISITGRGSERFNQAVSLTRSVVSNCQGDGVRICQSPACIVLDSRITSVGKTALVIDSPSSIVANTLCSDSDGGVVLCSTDGILIRNQLLRNGTGICLENQSEYSLVYENSILDNETGIVFEGKRATVGWNLFKNKEEVIVGGSKNILYSNHGILADSIRSAGVAYFNPPTTSNPHHDRFIWKSDSGDVALSVRRDVVVISGSQSPMIKEVTKRLRQERVLHPDAVLVVHMQGSFRNQSDEGLVLPDHTCVILDGEIINDYVSDKLGTFELVHMQGKGCNSFSGGRIISENKVFAAISGAGASNAFLLDGVDVDLHSEHGGLGSNSVNAVSSKEHFGPFVVRGCTIQDPGHRGIWMHVSKRVYALRNRCSAGGFSIDFDAYCFHSAAIFNTVTRNSYHSGIFFEECVKSNTAFGNLCEKNPANGICMWTENVQGKTEKNIVACNEIRGGVQMEANRSGLSLGGRAADRTTENNYFFNNRLEDLNGRSAILLKKHARENYISQSVLRGNDVDIRNWTSKPETNGFREQSGFHSPAVQ